jgi:alpha-maltose-1-phosphate synthase
MISNNLRQHPTGARIAFVALHDANNPNSFSGAPYEIRKGFLDLGCEVIDVFPLFSKWNRFIFEKIAHRLKGRYYSSEVEKSLGIFMAKEIMKNIKNKKIDFIFSANSFAVSELKVDIPIVISHDQTFVERMDYFPYEARPPADCFVNKAIEQERKAFERASICAYPSRRSMESLKKHYDLSDDQLALVPWGANLPSCPERAEVMDAIEKRCPKQISLAFVGVDWERKGGPVVAQTIDILRERGHDVKFVALGTNPVDVPIEEVAYVDHLNKYSSNGSYLYAELLLPCDFLFVPSRVEAFGHVFCEAAAFGVPSIATNVGGIPTVIDDHVTGRTLPLDADAQAYADVIEELHCDREAYTSMAKSARRKFESELNWRRFCESILSRIPRAS